MATKTEFLEQTNAGFYDHYLKQRKDYPMFYGVVPLIGKEAIPKLAGINVKMAQNKFETLFEALFQVNGRVTTFLCTHRRRARTREIKIVGLLNGLEWETEIILEEILHYFCGLLFDETKTEIDNWGMLLD